MRRSPAPRSLTKNNTRLNLVRILQRHTASICCDGKLNTYTRFLENYITIMWMLYFYCLPYNKTKNKKKEIISTIITFLSGKILSQSIVNHCAVFWHLISLENHGSITQTGLPVSPVPETTFLHLNTQSKYRAETVRFMEIVSKFLEKHEMF